MLLRDAVESKPLRSLAAATRSDVEADVSVSMVDSSGNVCSVRRSLLAAVADAILTAAACLESEVMLTIEGANSLRPNRPIKSATAISGDDVSDGT